MTKTIVIFLREGVTVRSALTGVRSQVGVENAWHDSDYPQQIVACLSGETERDISTIITAIFSVAGVIDVEEV